MYTLYILRCKDGSLYTGIAKNLEKRLEMHRDGTGSKYVRAKMPFELVYTEKWEDRSSATKREMKIKKMSKKNKNLLIEHE